MQPTIERGSFFEGVTHTPADVRGVQLASAFYHRVGGFDTAWTVRSSWAGRLLSGTPLRPIRVAPGRALLTVSAMSYQDSDAGPYNELLIGLPVRVAGRDGFVSPLRWFEHGGGLYLWQVGVTTEIARTLGIEILGWPKFLADIDIDLDADRMSLSVSTDGQVLLAVSARRPECHPGDERQRFDMFARRGGHLLRCQSIVHVLETGVRFRGTDARLMFGDHPVAEALRGAGIGRLVGVSVAPRSEMVLSGVLESWTLPRRRADADLPGMAEWVASSMAVPNAGVSRARYRTPGQLLR